MNELYELRDKLREELEEYSHKEMTANSLDVIDKLAHALKNLDKVIDAEEGGYSGREPMMYRRSYARNRDSKGRYSRTYSYDGDMIHELRSMMEDAPDEKTRQEFQRFIQKMESM